MAATIKPIEAKSIHQIQAGQVIVDLCSVVKELVENALDAGASTIEVRFKNYGLDSIEVQDNGTGIARSNYEGLALKHYTSKLSTYDDLGGLQTFGFRGEALSSLCALSTLIVTTAEAHEVPKGNVLDFETSGKLKSTRLTAAQKGTTVSVENLFSKLPVRQKELSKNIKREYAKVLGLLQAYACISTTVKFTVKNAMPKGRSIISFSTKGNAAVRDNMANVYGAKMLSQLMALDLEFDLPSSLIGPNEEGPGSKVEVVGYISKPVFGEGRQTPDRQMFFVNGRPCGLPQIAKAINEVYKSYNISQSAFILADLKMDTNNYDVNVSPDKRTIFLHNAAELTDRLKDELTKRFDATDQTVPQSHVQHKLPSFRPLTVTRDQPRELVPSPQESAPLQPPTLTEGASEEHETEEVADMVSVNSPPLNLLEAHFGNITSTREEEPRTIESDSSKAQKAAGRRAEKIAKAIAKSNRREQEVDDVDDTLTPYGEDTNVSPDGEQESPIRIPVRDFNARMREQQAGATAQRTKFESEAHTSSTPMVMPQSIQLQERGAVPHAFATMRPRRPSPEVATITIGDKVITKVIGTSKSTAPEEKFSSTGDTNASTSQFSQRLKKFSVARGEDRGQNPAESEVEESGEQSLPLEHNEETEEQVVVEGIQETPPEVDRDDSPVQDLTHTPEDSEAPAMRTLDTTVSNEVPGYSQEDRTDYEKIARTEAADRTQEEYRVAELIRMAETMKQVNGKERQKRTTEALKTGIRDSTVSLIAISDEDRASIKEQAICVKQVQDSCRQANRLRGEIKQQLGRSEEEQLALTMAKSDFGKMHIAGQFNLGFIIATRHRDSFDRQRQQDELFIIDQHASDEKYNFERLQAETIVGNQRLVHPVILDLTAVEEEIVLEHETALQQNGFIIETDTSGDYAVGQRCQLLSLPLSREVTFNTRDLEELIHLLSESHLTSDSTYVPRPSKVRKMFAMRACRSSIMIGKTLSRQQMRRVVDHMGKIDKPWNCPHGRPTMRHLLSLDEVDEQLWREGDGLVSENRSSGKRADTDIWKAYLG